MDDRIELVCKKIPTFTIEESFGNQFIIYELLEVEKIKMDNGCYFYHSYVPFLKVDVLHIIWQELDKLPDINGV